MIDNLQAIIAALQQPKTPNAKDEIAPKNFWADNNSSDPDLGLPTPHPNAYAINDVIQSLQGQHPQMPFPDNHNPNMDFVNRFPAQLPPNGTMNDLRPGVPDPILQRKLNMY